MDPEPSEIRGHNCYSPYTPRHHGTVFAVGLFASFRAKGLAFRAEATTFFNKMPDAVLKLEDLVVEALSHVLLFLR